MTSARKPPRVVVDTNLFVSGLIVKRGIPHQLLSHWRRGSFTLLISEEQREEIGAVLDRPVSQWWHRWWMRVQHAAQQTLRATCYPISGARMGEVIHSKGECT